MSPEKPDNYFAQFALPRHLNIDTAALEKTFYAQSRKLHPDRFASRPLPEQEAALAASSQLNDAYRTLRDPIARTEYLLALEGIQLEEQSRAATDAARASGTEKKQVAPPDLLEEAFELNMQLEEMRMNRKMGEDDPQLRGDLEKARANFESQLAALDSNLQQQWTRWDAALGTAGAEEKNKIKDEMVALLDRRRYIRNLVRDVNDALEG
jgi:molecular chaperone HscB